MMDKYIPLRRDNGGCKAAFALIEYGLGIDLPDYVVEHPVMQALDQETNDFVAWSNVRYVPRYSPSLKLICDSGYLFLERRAGPR